ncbi:hypothetical protein [Tabrizicola sp.]|uniref:hypothetical protein n=1 Tax=Tabrizicola sp. TaxID=2005166 RepID=UPI0027368392|nr:hypothetical protein [Tabrizicola sp.]MDP3198022.1 hypothetical protein [Tabrizicola sp.]
MHYHRSTQDDIDYHHQGPIYHVNGRIYMLGVGSNDREKYFRPMIFKARDLPEKSVTFGIVLTELADSYIPLSAKVALVSEKDVRLADLSKKEGFLADLADRLRIDSETNVIYGAEANKP